MHNSIFETLERLVGKWSICASMTYGFVFNTTSNEYRKDFYFRFSLRFILQTKPTLLYKKAHIPIGWVHLEYFISVIFFYFEINCERNRNEIDEAKNWCGMKPSAAVKKCLFACRSWVVMMLVLQWVRKLSFHQILLLIRYNYNSINHMSALKCYWPLKANYFRTSRMELRNLHNVW